MRSAPQRPAEPRSRVPGRRPDPHQRSHLNPPLHQIDAWPVANVAAAIIGRDDTALRGPADHVFALASLSKVITTWAMLVASEEGTISLDTPVGQPGCTLRHLLSHAGGYAFDGPDPISPPERRRIYSNTGIEIAVAALEQATDIAFATYLAEAVLEPLGMTSARLVGSAASGVVASLNDMVRFVGEVMHPRLISGDTASTATSIHFPELTGVVPGVGTFRPCPWGLGVEIHGNKHPHWMGTTNSPETFGHFGGAGTMMWTDPVHGVSLIALTDRPYGEWAADALRLWPQLSDAVIAAAGGSS